MRYEDVKSNFVELVARLKIFLVDFYLPLSAGGSTYYFLFRPSFFLFPFLFLCLKAILMRFVPVNAGITSW